MSTNLADDQDRLGRLAMQFRGTRDNARREAIAREYAQTVQRLIDSGCWDEMPGPEDELPDEFMPQAYFDFLLKDQSSRRGKAMYKPAPATTKMGTWWTWPWDLAAAAWRFIAELCAGASGKSTSSQKPPTDTSIPSP